MAVKYLSNKFKDLQVGITNYSENKGSSLYVVGNVGVGTNDATAEVGISNTSVLAVGILTAYKIFSSVYGEFTGAFSGGTVQANSLTVSGISTLGNVKVSGGIVTATTGVVTYYGDGQYLTGIDVENPSQLNVSGVSTFAGAIDANGTLDVDGSTNLDDLVVTGVATFNNTVNLSSLLDCNGGADIDTLTAATAKISDLTDTRIVIAGANGELADSAQLRYVSSTLTVGTNLDVGGHTELGDVNVGGAITATTFTGNLAGIVNSSAQPNITSLGTLTALSVSGTGLQVQHAAAGVALDVSGYTELDTVSVASTSTFTDDINANGNIIGDGQTNISGINSLTVSTRIAHTGDTSTSLAFATGVISLISDGNTRLSVIDKETQISGGLLVTTGDSGGIATFAGNIDANADLDVDGHTELDDVNVSGVSTFVGDAVFNGNVSIAGTLTKEDVTNIDSVGLITARSGVRITGGGLTAVGVATFSDAIDANGGANISGGSGLTASSIKVSSLADNKIVVSGANGELINDTELSYDRTGNALTLTGNLFLPNAGNHAGIGTASKLGTGTDSLSVWANSVQSGVRIWASASGGSNDDAIPLQVADYQGTEYFRVANTGNVGISSAIPSQKLDVVGTVKATSFIGDGSGLTNLSVSGGLWVANSAGIHTTVDVGIGTTNPSAAVTSANTAKLAVGIVSAYKLYGEGSNVTDVSWGSSPGSSSFITQGSQTAVGGDAGDWQVIAGYWAGCCANNNTSYNVIFGQSAGRKLVDGDRNVLIGSDVGCGLTTGMRNVYMGSSTAQDSVSGDYNIGLGYKTLRTSTGSCNVAIGFCAADGNTSGTNNVIIGKNANSDVGGGGNDNVWVGTDSGGYASGSCNTFVGAQSGYGVYNGTFNIGLGYEAGRSLIQQTAHHNISIGTKAGLNGTTGSCNVFLGTCAGRSVSTGQLNLFAGYKAGDAVTVGTRNVYLGNCAGAGSTDGHRNIAIGNFSGWLNTTGCCNVYIGSCAGTYNCTGSNNIAIGRCSGFAAHSTSNNTFIGDSSGSKLTLGEGNVFLGTNTGLEATNAGCNVFIGNNAGQGNTNTPLLGGCNIAVGAFAGNELKGGDDNVFLGTRAGKSSSDSNQNVFLGYYAGSLNTGHCNIFIGSHAGNTNTIGVSNIAIGPDVCLPSATGDRQLAIGSGSSNWIAGDSNFNTTLSGIVTAYASGIVRATSYYGDGSNLTNIGGGTLISGITVQEESSTVGTAGSIKTLDFQGASITATASGTTATITVVGAGTTDGWTQDSEGNLVAGEGAGASRDADTCTNIMVGCNAGNAVDSGCYNTFLGCGAGQFVTGGHSNVAIGCSAGQNLTSTAAFHQVFIGSGAGMNATCINSRMGVAIGYKAGCTQVCYDVFIGCGAGRSNETGSHNIMLGFEAGSAVTSGCCNTIIGSLAGYCLTTGNRNVFLGERAGKCVTSSCQNIFVGYYAGYNTQNTAVGPENIVMGVGAGMCLGANAARNTIIGPGAGEWLKSGCCNIAIGPYAGHQNDGGDHNTFLGSYAGGNNTSGGCNVAIGKFVCLPSATGSNQFAIGCCKSHWITGDANFNVGIGTNRHDTVVGSAVTAKLSVGIVSAYQLYGGGEKIEPRKIYPTSSGLNINYKLLFANGIDSYEVPYVDAAGFTYNPSTNALTAGYYYGDGSNLVGVAKSTVLQDAGINTSGTTTLNHFVVTGISTFGNNISVTGTASASDFNSTSDIRLKTNIKRIEDPLAKVVRIEGVTFDWKEWNRPALGVIADQVEEVIPELVQGTDPKTVNYNGLIGLLIEAVKEQQTQIDDLKSRLSKLE